MDAHRRRDVENFDSLRERCRELGLFERSTTRNFAELGLIVLSAIAALALRSTFHTFAILCATMGAITLVWWIHDSGHDAIFSSRRKSHFFIEAFGVVFLGMPQVEYHSEVHRIHHAHTNIIGKDGALETGPVRWHLKQLRHAADRFHPYQSLLWFAVILPLVWPILSTRSIFTLWQRGKYGRLVAVIARWAVVLWFFGNDPAFIFLPPLIAGFVMGFASSLNHFPMPMDDRKLDMFPRSVFLTTQNLRERGPFMTWLTGGLNFHIEHHLFPTMPSENLRRAAPLVETFARQNNLPYEMRSSVEAVRSLNRRLRDPNHPSFKVGR